MINYGLDLLVHGRRCDGNSSSPGLPPLFVFHVFKVWFQLACMEDGVYLQMMGYIDSIGNLANLGNDLERPLILANQTLTHTPQ